MKDQPEITGNGALSQLLKILEAAKAEDRSVNRLLRIHEAAQLGLRDLEADFQFQLQESIQQTEARLKQRFAGEQEEKIRQTEEEVRKATTRELLARFEVDFQKLNEELEANRKNAIAATENAAQLRLKEVLGEAERAREDLRRQFESAAEQWEIERQQLKADFEDRRLKAIAATEAAAEFLFEEKLAEAKQDFERREQEIQAAADQRCQKTSDDFDAERKEFHQRIATLEEEIARFKKMGQQAARTPLSRQLEAKLEEVTRENARLEEELRGANSPRKAERHDLETKQAARNDTRDVSDAVKAEIARIESRRQDVSQKIEDPSTDLGTQIRLDRERSELEAYLKGLRYSMGEITFNNQA